MIPGEFNEPKPDDPNTWQCCQCDSLQDGDEVVPLTWSGTTMFACPRCGHEMTVRCCCLRRGAS